MKTRITALLLAAALPLGAQASPPQATILAIDCGRPALPTQGAVARFTGIENFGRLYVARTHLMIQVRRECHRGAGRVELVLQKPRRDRTPTQRLAEVMQPTP